MKRFINRSSLLILWVAFFGLVLIESIRLSIAPGQRSFGDFLSALGSRWNPVADTDEAVIFVSLIGALLSGLMRKIRGGDFYDADQFVRDTIGWVVVYVLALVWFDLVLGMGPGYQTDTPLGKMTLTLAVFGLVSQRLATIFRV